MKCHIGLGYDFRQMPDDVVSAGRELIQIEDVEKILADVKKRGSSATSFLFSLFDAGRDKINEPSPNEIQYWAMNIDYEGHKYYTHCYADEFLANYFPGVFLYIGQMLYRNARNISQFQKS